jgi:enamine deaminase RidA (YjgF/YER057c/UK114 family)
MPNIQTRHPESLAKPVAPYSNIARVKASKFLFIAGQVGTDKDGKTPPASKGKARSPSPTLGPHSPRRAQASPTSWNS